MMSTIVDDEDFEAMKKMGLPTSFMPTGVSLLGSQVIFYFKPHRHTYTCLL